MIRRLIALALWSYFAWYLAAMLASAAGGPSVAGPIAALLTFGAGLMGWARARGGTRQTSRRVELRPTR